LEKIYKMNLAKQAESDGRQDFNAETFGTDENYEGKGDHWETFKDGKYLPDYDQGWRNAEIDHDLTLEKKQLEENNKMSITKEQLRSLIREQMSNVSEVADDDVPMMPPKPVDPEGIAGTDVPVSTLEQGLIATEEAIVNTFPEGSDQYELAMNVINILKQQKSRKPPSPAELWDRFKDIDSVDPEIEKRIKNPFRVTKENLERIIKEELAIALEGLGPAGKTARKAAPAKIDVSEYPRKQGRDDGADGKERRYPEGKAVEYDEGYEEGMEIKLALDNAFGRLEETSVNEQ